jgi:C4-dicarboxylate-specific signal transduction histidine kinase
MKTSLTLDIRRVLLVLGGVVLLMLLALTAVSALLVWDSNRRLGPLHQQALILADAQDRLLDHLAVEQGLLDRKTQSADPGSEAEIRRRDTLMGAMDAVVRQVSTTLDTLRSAQSDYTALNAAAAVGIVLLLLALVALALVARERVLIPMGKLSRLLGRLAREDFRQESIEGVDTFIRPAFESYNRLVGRLARLERAHQARHRRMETQVREATRALVAQRADLARVERLAAVGEVVASLAHELRNPLTAIRAACRSLIEDTAEPDSRERLGLIEEEIERLAELVEVQLRRARHRPEEAKPTDLTRLIRNLVRLLKYQMPASVTLRMRLPRRLPALLPPNGLRQVLLNLIRNAQEGLAGRNGTIWVEAEGSEQGLAVRVEDDGPGFPEDVLAAGVHRFATGKRGGTGLGLAMAERYVRDQGGRLLIGNRPEGGARVCIELPPELPPGPPPGVPGLPQGAQAP